MDATFYSKAQAATPGSQAHSPKTANQKPNKHQTLGLEQLLKNFRSLILSYFFYIKE